MKLLYFARVREAVGLDTEERELPLDVETIGEFLAWLKQQGENYATALADPSSLRFALDQQMVREETPIEGASELAIFPPVTGG